MQHSKIMGVLFAASTLAVSQMSFAAGDFNALHSYNCRLVYDGGSYQEISGGFQAGKYVNISGAAAWLICPLDCEASNSTHYVYLSAATTACSLGRTYVGGGSTSYYAPTGSGSGTGYYYAYWSNLACSTAYPMEIQCRVPNGASVFGYLSL